MGAHCDDVEIGCGATLAKLVERYPALDVRVCVYSGNDKREAETRRALAQILNGHGSASIEVMRFRNGHFPYCASEIKAHMESYKAFDPDIVFTHYRHDLHQDHRTIADLTGNTFRDHLILQYEILKYDGDIGNPNVFIPMGEDELESKISILMSSFESQLDKQWFTPDVFRSLARIRGVHGATASGYAEAFYNEKLALTFD